MKHHKAGCMANMQCLVYHEDGICPGPYGKCTCEEPMTTKHDWREEFDKEFVHYPPGRTSNFGIILSPAEWKDGTTIGDVIIFIEKVEREAYERGKVYSATEWMLGKGKELGEKLQKEARRTTLEKSKDAINKATLHECPKNGILEPENCTTCFILEALEKLDK